MKHKFILLFILMISALLFLSSCMAADLSSSASLSPAETTINKENTENISDNETTANGTAASTTGAEDDETATSTNDIYVQDVLPDENIDLDYLIEKKEIYEKDEEKFIEIIAGYPYFIHEEGAEVFNSANLIIYDEYINYDILDFKDLAEQTAEFGKDNYSSPFVLEINYFLEYADNYFVSVLFYYFSFTGGAHPNNKTFAFNYDIAKRKQILLNDLFAAGYDYLSFLSAYCFEDIKRQYLEMEVDFTNVEDWVQDGTDTEDPVNFENFNLSKEGMIITFNPYDVGPYVMGPFKVIIPYDEFNGNIIYPVKEKKE